MFSQWQEVNLGFFIIFFCRSGLCKALKETTKKMVTPCCVRERCACAIEVSVEMTGLSECVCVRCPARGI